MSQENVELVQAAFDAISRRDLQAVLALCHPEIEFRPLIAEAEDHTFKGHQGVREWFADRMVPLNLRPTGENIEGFRDRGVNRLHLTGTFDGVDVSQSMWMAWRVRDGLISWWAAYRTEDEALEAVGLRG